MKYLSLFSGIGGFEYGIRQSEIKSKNSADSESRASQLPRCPLCVGFSEIDKYATQIYKKHFPNHKELGDVTKIDETTLPDFDMLVGGFPCQSFSIAGKRGGFDDTRGTMFFEIARIVREKQPRILLLENVKGLLSHDKGATFATILSTLDELVYDVEWQVLNSKNFGVPQNRERVFIIGHLRGSGGGQVFPIGESSRLSIKGIREGEAACEHSTAITTNYRKGVHSGGETYAIPVLTPDRPEKRQNGRRFKEDGEPSFTLTAQDKHGVYDGARIRRLTPTECGRLQGFPDGWTEGISDTQRYKCLGNAVTVNVIEAIMGEILIRKGGIEQ